MNSEPEDSEQEEGAFGGRLRMLALRVGSVTALAKSAGIPQSTIRRYFDKSDPPLSALPKLARAGGVSLAWLITGEGPIQMTRKTHIFAFGSFLCFGWPISYPSRILRERAKSEFPISD
jgi:hypothetical protein